MNASQHGAVHEQYLHSFKHLTDAYCSPVWLTSRLPLVHGDPCSNPRSTVRAVERYMLETGQNGLALPWWPSVFINWPYSDPAPWACKLLAEIAAGRVHYAIILPKHDHSTEWWAQLTAELPRGSHALDQWQFRDRLQFNIPPELLAEIAAEHHAAQIAARLAKGRQDLADKYRARVEAGTAKYNPSNNFCSTLLHWRPCSMPALELADVATLWQQAA